MSDGKLEFLDETPEVEAEEVTPEAEEPAQAAPEAEADEPEAEAEGTGDQGEPPSPEFKSSRNAEHQAPLTALLDEREKRQKAEREAEELRQWRRQMEQREQQAKAKVPDVFEDQEGFIRHTQQAFQQELLRNKMDTSRFLAEREYGADTLQEAVAFFDQHPDQSWRFLQEPSPYHAAVEYYRKQKALSEIGDDPDKWKQSQLETLKEQLRQELMAEMGQQPQTAPRKPPVSLTGQPAAGRGDPTAKGTGFDAAFPS